MCFKYIQFAYQLNFLKYLMGALYFNFYNYKQRLYLGRAGPNRPGQHFPKGARPDELRPSGRIGPDVNEL